MKHIQTLNGATLKASAAKGGCGECRLLASLPARLPALLPIRSARISKFSTYLKRVGVSLPFFMSISPSK